MHSQANSGDVVRGAGGWRSNPFRVAIQPEKTLQAVHQVRRIAKPSGIAKDEQGGSSIIAMDIEEPWIRGINRQNETINKVWLIENNS